MWSHDAGTKCRELRQKPIDFPTISRSWRQRMGITREEAANMLGVPLRPWRAGNWARAAIPPHHSGHGPPVVVNGGRPQGWQAWGVTINSPM
jgi:hypothetical protein